MSEAVDEIMIQAQVFASAWSLVGGRFDTGHCSDDAKEAKLELERMVRAALAAAPAQPVAPVWQRIDSAPRDGTSIIVAFGQDGVSQARYIPGLPHPWQFLDIEGAKIGKPWTSNYAVDGAGGPSHWVNLPEYLNAPAQHPWQYTPLAQERIDALELEVRQLTEQIAALRHAPTPQADSQPAPLREGEWINDAGRIKWLMWRVQDLEAKLAARAPADSVLEDAARYQWIRGPGEESTRYSRWNIEYWDGPNGWQPMQRESMDSAIDAARKQGGA